MPADQGSNPPPDLVSSRDIEGADVYGRSGERLGEVEKLLIDKRSGRVAYVVVSFGGFLGIGEKLHPLPWDVLRSDAERGGYAIDLTREELEAAPTYPAGEEPEWHDPEYASSIYSYYRTFPFWIGPTEAL